jgi:hypothetical protein
MYDNIDPIGQQNSIDNNRATYAQNSPSGTATEFSEPHIHNDGTYGFDAYEFDSAGNRVTGEDMSWTGARGSDDHGQARFGGSNQSSLTDHGVEQQPLIGGKLEQQGQNQFGGVDSVQQDLNQF